MVDLEKDVVDDALTEEALQEKLSSLVNDLEKKADDQVRRKSEIELRWLEDKRAFHGRYDADTEAQLKEGQKSRAFVKITRKKTNSWDARLSALLFPTDDENWDARPTPVPTLHEDAKRELEEAAKAIEGANETQEQDPAKAQEMAQLAQTKLDNVKVLDQELQQAKRAGEAMKQEMRDQLVECDYPAQCRMVIRDACQIGTGILKGPLTGDKSRGKWLQLPPEKGGMYVYNREEDPAPTFRWVDPWSYFPDMSATRPNDREFEFERHLWSGKELRRLVREAGFSAKAVADILRGSNKGVNITSPGFTYLAELRSLTGSSDIIKDRFVGWEYHGPLDCEQFALCLRATGEEELANEYEDREDKELHEVRVIAFFCDGKLLKISPAYPLDSGDSLYSIFTFEDSEASIFGYGIPYIMADSQKSMNGAWRMALDNAGLSVGPQIFIDRDQIEPANNSWEITPRKVWFRKKGAGLSQGEVLEVKNIPNNVIEIMNIVDTSRRFIDDETALPVQAEGELTDNPNITATATNFMSLASNITFRRVVKNFDDGITMPTITRLYDWNMQHNSRTDIKGDMKVDARGSSALLQRELQANMLLNIAQNWSTHPVLKHALRSYDAIVDAVRASMIQPTTILSTKEEFEQAIAAEAKAASENQPQDPTIVAAQARLKAAEIDSQSRVQVATIDREVEMMKVAQQYQFGIDKLKALLAGKEMDIDSKERIFASEVAVEEDRQAVAAASGQEAKGSGGFL